MRRAQSVRNHARPSLAAFTLGGADDLGVLREGEESTEDLLRRQLIEQGRENDRLKTQVEALQAQLAHRPPLEEIQTLEKEHKSLELLLVGTQRENERCMADIERARTREKMLERELAKLAGENWQTSLDIAPAPASSVPPGRSMFHQRSNTLGSMHVATAPSPSADAGATQLQIDQQATLAHIEQIRMLIMGMEQRLQTREDKLVKSVERAESEGKRFEDLRKEMIAATSE